MRNNCCIMPVSHTVKEWAELPDEVSQENVWYVYSDYRTDNDVNVPRFKFGDGVTMISKLPFVTAAITDNDMELWDGRSDMEGNHLGEIVEINEEKKELIFPTDGYITLEFSPDVWANEQVKSIESAEVRIYGASGDRFFTLKKNTFCDDQSKEVFVRKGMRCMYISATSKATIKFVPLV